MLRNVIGKLLASTILAVAVTNSGCTVKFGNANADGGVDENEGGGSTDCPAGLSTCGDGCVDLTADNANCGACGFACPGTTSCADASCCPSPTILCGDACLDPREDDQNCGACGNVCPGSDHCVAGACTKTNIEHVVLIVQENHTFDAYFGRYCTAPAGSNPSCNEGPDCCEAAPAKEPRGASPIILDDAENFDSDRDHKQECEVQQINGGKMDGFVSGSSGADTCYTFGPDCANPKNWALAGASTVGPYWAYADKYALADRYFQPIAGGTSSNDMYFAVAHVQFIDNQFIPAALGTGCTDPSELCLDGKKVSYKERTTIVDLLEGAGRTFGAYMDGYAEAAASAPSCPSAPDYCPYSSCTLHPVACHGCVYDASDNPFVYYAQHADKPYIRDYGDLQADLDAGTLPSFAYVKARAYRNEHPNVSKITHGVKFVQDTINAIESSSLASTTLVILTWDEGGGFFDHVAPPAGIDTDAAGKPVPYGTRVPMLAIGPFARKGYVSHVTMEHSSIVRFLEYNFVGPVGQLGANDAKVNNIGSLLDKAKSGIHVPE